MLEENILLAMLDEISDTRIAVLSEDDIKKASQHRSVLVRCKVCDAVIYYSESFARELLLTLLLDRNPEVRAGAACYLENYTGTSVIVALQNSFIHDKDPYVRGYGGRALLKQACFNDQIVSAVEISLLKERNLFVRNCCYGALYLFCSKKNVLNKIVYCFRSKNYRTRCATAITLMEILNAENALEILRVVNYVSKNENVLAVQDVLERLRQKALRLLNNTSSCFGNTEDG